MTLSASGDDISVDPSFISKIILLDEAQPPEDLSHGSALVVLAFQQLNHGQDFAPLKRACPDVKYVNVPDIHVGIEDFCKPNRGPSFLVQCGSSRDDGGGDRFALVTVVNDNLRRVAFVCGRILLAPTKSAEGPASERFQFQCRSCGQTYDAAPKLIRKIITCRKCGQKMPVPAPPPHPLDSGGGPFPRAFSWRGTRNLDVENVAMDVASRIVSRQFSASDDLRIRLAKHIGRVERIRRPAPMFGAGAMLAAIDSGTLDANLCPIETINFGTDDRTVITGCNDGAVRIWDGSTGGLLRATDTKYLPESHDIQGHTQRVRSVALGPPQTFNVTCSEDKSVQVWTSDWNWVGVLGVHTAISVDVDSCGQRAVSCGRFGDIFLWDLPARTAIRTMRWQGTMRNHDDNDFLGVRFVPHANAIVTTGCDRMLRFWPLASNSAEIRVYDCKAQPLGNAIAVTPDGQIVAVGCEDGCVRIWETDSGILRRTIKVSDSSPRALALNANRHIIVTGDLSGKVAVSNLLTGELLGTLSTGFKIDALAVTSEGRYVAAGGDVDFRLCKLP